jgi:DNA-binding LacI/PurR family transcriptional regulator
VTVLAGLRLLKERGILESQQGSCYRLCGHPEALGSSVRDTEGRTTRSEEIAGSIKEDLLAGRIGPQIPTSKELCVRFGCSHRTIRSALSALAAKQLLRRHGSTYRGSMSGRRASGQAHVYFAAEQRLLESDSVISFVMGLERELEARRWGRLRFLIGDAPEDCHPPQDHQVAGFVHYYDGKASLWPAFLRQRRAIPSVMLNLHEVAPPAHGPGRRLVTIIPDDRRAGRELGMHLAGLGHTHCAFITRMPLSDGCAMLRLSGLSEIYPYSPHARTRRCSVFDGSATAGGAEPPAGVLLADPRLGALNADIERVAEAVQRDSGLPEVMVRQGFGPAYGMLRWWSGFAALRPIFEQVHAESSVTAWVCSDDSLAVLAHAFITQKGRTPGVDLSLASFDNSRIANTLGITSYDFGFDVMGRLAAHCLVAPHLTSFDQTNSMHVPGQLVSRASTQAER